MRALAVAVGFLLAGCGAPMTTVERFSDPWIQPSPLIMRLLAAHHIQGCGEFYMKAAKDAAGPPENGDFLIYCTRDGDHWTAWEAFPGNDNVLGPLTLEPGIALPDRDKISN